MPGAAQALLVGVVAGLVSSVMFAETPCSCEGEAEIFRRSQQFLELRYTGEPVCEGKQCRLMPGQLQRVYFLGSSPAAGSVRHYFNRSGQQLNDKPVGYVFAFHFATTVRDGSGSAEWTAELR